MTNKLDTICANHIRALRTAYLSEEEMRHRNCTGNNLNCPNYIPFCQISEEPIKQGELSYLLATRQ